MDHTLPLISTLVMAFGLALILGYLAECMKMPALVGYLMAGIMASSNTPGPFADAELASQLSEIGVMLLMFGVGLHFSINDLLKVKNIAVPGAILQMSIATVLGMGFSMVFWQWQPSEALVFGLCLSCTSTVVLLKVLEMTGNLNTVDGQIAIGWLVVEDLTTVVILVLLPPAALILSTGGTTQGLSFLEIAWILTSTILRVVAFVALMLVVGRKLIPWALMKVAITGSRELFTLFILTSSIGIAYGAASVFEVSFAVGAFFAGTVMRESKYAHRAAKDSLPLQDAFSVLFFVGVGMMLDWRTLVNEPLAVLCVLFIVMVGKTTTSFLLVHFFRYPLHTSLNVSAALGQIGEFSYILAAQGIALKMVSPSLMSMIVAASILTIALNPVMFALLPMLRRLLLRWFGWARAAAILTDPYSVLPKETERRLLINHVILVGSGTVSALVTDELLKREIPFVSIVEDKSLAESMRASGLAVITGEPSDPMVLVQAHIVTASMLVIPGSDATKAKRILEMARELNSDMTVMVRAQDDLQEQRLKSEGIVQIFSDKQAVSDGLTQTICRRFTEDRESE